MEVWENKVNCYGYYFVRKAANVCSFSYSVLSLIS